MKEKIINILKKLHLILICLYKNYNKVKHIVIPVGIYLIVPIIVSFILGYEMEAHQVLHIKTMIVNHDTSATTKTLVDQIKENETFNVTTYSDNNDDIKKAIDKGEIYLGIIIPKNFSDDLMNGKSTKIMTIYDGSLTTPVTNGKTKIAEILGTIKAAYLMKISEAKLNVMPEVAKNSIMPIQYESRFIGNPTKNMLSFFVQGILLTSVHMGVVLVCILVLKKENKYIVMLLKSIGIGLIGAFEALAVIYVQYKYFQVPFRGSIKAAILLSIAYHVGMSALGLLLYLLQNYKQYEAMSSASIISASMMLSGYTYPLIAMPNALKVVAKYLPFTYYGLPMRDLTLLKVDFIKVIPDLIWLLKFIGVMWGLTLLKYIVNKKIKNRKKKIKKQESEQPEIINREAEVVV